MGEVTAGDPEAVGRRMKVLAGVESLVATEEARALADTLLRAHALPEKARTDALHVALAAVRGADLLLTWNCRHMANPVALPKTISTIARSGYQSPVIITPEDFLNRKEEFGL